MKPLAKLDARDGFTEEQFQRLKGRGGLYRKASEEEKWIEVYKILFPGISDIPSPRKSLQTLHLISNVA
jgi:hypothetical protein